MLLFWCCFALSSSVVVAWFLASFQVVSCVCCFVGVVGGWFTRWCWVMCVGVVVFCVVVVV